MNKNAISAMTNNMTKKITIPFLTPNSNVVCKTRVLAHVYHNNIFAIHHTLTLDGRTKSGVRAGRAFTLTHLPTRRCIGYKFSSHNDAFQAMIRIKDLIDWNFTYEERIEKVPFGIRKEITAILRGWSSI